MATENILSQQTQRPLNLLQQAINPKGVTREQLERTVAQVAGFVKMMTGVADNAALIIMLDCLEKVRQHPRYRHKVKHLVKEALRERDRWRSALLHPAGDGIRFFKVSDMPEESRRKYGVLSDESYFEFWEGTGSLAYQRSRPLVTSLQNKFRLSLQSHGVPHADLLAWGLVGANCLELSVVVWQRAMKSAHEAFDGLLTQEFVESLYRPFSLRRVSRLWTEAVKLMGPEVATYALDPADERNIQLGVEQLMELWISPDLPFDATIQAVEDFQDDIFATHGYAKKAMRELSEMRNQAVADLQQQFAEERKAMLEATK